MPINDPFAPGSVRRPRLRVLNAGAELPALRAEVSSNSHYQADTFRVEFSLNADPAYNATWWGDQAKVPVDIEVSLDGSGWTSILVGEIDHVDVHFPTGLVACEGRDLTARLIEARTQETFLNQTSSQVATTLAGRHGLTPVVTSTPTLVSRYYQQDHDSIRLGQFSHTRTEWDLLTFLAQREGFDAFVQGNELHFQPRTPPSADPYVVVWRQGAPVPFSNVIDLRTERALTLAKDIEVVVHSWRSSEGRGFNKTARAIGAKSASASKSANQKGTDTQRFVFTFPNLTEADAQTRANNILADLSRHERLVNWREPGNTILTARNLVQVDGTGTSWDQTYYVDTISRSLDVQGGFTQSVRAKNHSPVSDAQV